MIPLYIQSPDFSRENALSEQYHGLICLTNSLSPDYILSAYQHGVFPWHEDDNGYVYWYTQNPRAVLLPEQLHIRRSLQKILRNQSYRVTVNHVFNEVIAACASIKRIGQNASWISQTFQQTYTQLHKQGQAHSFECWLPENDHWILAGGLYGVQIGCVFYGESMFAQRNNASKIAFACAVPFLQRCGIRLIDCQQNTQHLSTFGSQTIPLAEFKRQLAQLNAIVPKQIIAPQIIQENKP